MASKVDTSHIRTVEEILEAYKVTENDGLTPERVSEQRKKFGYNGEFEMCGKVCVWMTWGLTVEVLPPVLSLFCVFVNLLLG